jgi:nucleotide-binding universal stress UspA family protein
LVWSDEVRRDLKVQHEERLKRFRVLVCIDGEDEGYRGLQYAVRMGGAREDCDIILLYVRPVDQGTGGLQVRVARENMLRWGLELPGIRRLKKGLSTLVADEEMEADWLAVPSHKDIAGDPLGDNKIEYRHPGGRSIVLKLKVAPDVASGILDQYELGPYNLIIMGGGSSGRSRLSAVVAPSTTEKVTLHAPCSVFVARDLVAGNGHLVCVDGSPQSIEAAKEEAIIAARFPDPKVSAICVAPDKASTAKAQAIVDAIEKTLLDELNFQLKATYVGVGDPVDEIIKAGKGYSAIVLGGSTKSTLQRMVTSSIPLDLVRKAPNSVMIIR